MKILGLYKVIMKEDAFKSPLPPFSKGGVSFPPLPKEKVSFPPLSKGDKGGFKDLHLIYRSFFSQKIVISQILFTIVLIVILPFTTLAQNENKFTIARLKYGGGGDWYYGQTQIPNLLKGLRERTNIDAGIKQEVIQLTDKKLYSYPFIYMTGHGNVLFTDEEVKALRLYLMRGGFLWANDDYGLDKSFRREMKKVFPEKDLVEVPFDHKIYHCYYDFTNGVPKIHEHDGKPPRGYGIFHEGRMIVFYNYESDIADGLEDPEIHNDPPEKREQALRMAINMVIYVLTN
jgi:hypothetical protein